MNNIVTDEQLQHAIRASWGDSNSQRQARGPFSVYEEGWYAALIWKMGHKAASGKTAAIPMLIWCPECGARHIDVGEFATKLHHTHACQECGHCWRPAIVPTVGVQFLPGFKNTTQEEV